MKLTNAELEYLAAWAREEWEPDCYQRPAHRLQMQHAIPGGLLIQLIKTWTTAEGKRDQDILTVASHSEPPWPWSSAEELSKRIHEAAPALVGSGLRGAKTAS